MGERRKPPYQEPGYSGVALDKLPEDIAGRIRDAITMTARTDATLMFSLIREEQGTPIPWPFGDENTDVFILTQARGSKSYHRGQEGFYEASFSGITNLVTERAVLKPLGLTEATSNRFIPVAAAPFLGVRPTPWEPHEIHLPNSIGYFTKTTPRKG
jgi:hypothetical protein